LVYNATTGLEDPNVAFQAYAGTKATKLYGQNYYVGGTWVGPSQSGVVYQEWLVAGTAGLSSGQAIHARGEVRVFGIDPLTGGSTFNFGFRYLNAANVPVSPDEVTTITASTDVPDQWVALVANGTVPAGATKVQLIAEFVQNNSTDTGAVYFDDLSVGLGLVPATKQVGSKTYQLVWSDEFDGSSLNPGNWTPETGAGGWGNNEVQTYTTSPNNLRVENGSLVIQAVKSSGAWTSARIKTENKRIFKYGLIEFRAKLPTGVGPWPAAWMMGNNIGSVGWPACGEIDVLEWRGYPTSDANTVGHAIHSPQRHGGNPIEASRSAVSNPSTQFHTYGALWTSTSVTFSVDGVDKATLEFPVEDRAAFQKEFFLLLNMAIGGNYLQGQIDPALNSATYEVDYVRVFQDPAGDEAYDPLPPLISVVGANPVSLAWGASYSDPGATAFDAGDNASVQVATVNPVDPSVPGDYWVTYTAQDSKGNSTNTNRLVSVTMANNGNNVGADGLTDSLRYAFGATGPGSISRTLLPSNSLTPGTNGTKNLVMTYFARTNENVSLIPWASANLTASNGWTTNGVIVTILSNVATNGTNLEKRQATTPATGSQKFLRLRSIFTE
jgi:beta-glucanase (GH16 family)